MSFFTYTNNITNGISADGANVMTNFNDVRASLIDATKDINIAKVTATSVNLPNLTLSTVLGLDALKNVVSTAIPTTNLKNITNWGATAWTPTGTWSTNVTYTGTYRRVGDTFFGRVQISLSGIPDNLNLSINLPASHTIDTTKLLSTDNGIPLGHCIFKDASGAPDFLTGPVSFLTTTTIEIDGNEIVGGFLIFRQANRTHPFTFATGDTLYIYIECPIVEYA